MRTVVWSIALAVSLIGVPAEPEATSALGPEDSEIARSDGAEAASLEVAAAEAEESLNRKKRIRIQKALNQRGFETGNPDGVFGRNTRNAIRTYQTAIGAAATGTLTPEQIDDLLGRAERPIDGDTLAGDYEVLADTDLDGGDIRLPWDDPTLRNISRGECQAACDAEPACIAYTFNRKAQMCFLKGHGYRQKAFAGAMSGKKTATVDVSYRPGESEADRVARIRAAAVPFGGDCNAEKATIERLQRETTVATAPTEVEAGGELALTWSRGPLTEPLPVYLMVATDKPVRFKGEHFYPLLPDARAPFGLETFKSKTRAIVPYYAKDLPLSGEIVIRPLVTGPLDLEWSVIGYTRRCGEEIAAAPANIAVGVVTASRPEIVVREAAPTTRPISVHDSPDGTRRIEAFDGRWRLLDIASGAEITERPGTDPRFSPTGRFVGARTKQYIEVVDSIDGAFVFDATKGPATTGMDVLGWRNEDSVISYGFAQWGRVGLRFSLMEGPALREFTGGGHVSYGLTTSYGRMDYENNLLIPGEQGVVGDIVSLTGLTDDRSSVSAFAPGSVESTLRDTAITHVNNISWLQDPNNQDRNANLLLSRVIELDSTVVDAQLGSEHRLSDASSWRALNPGSRKIENSGYMERLSTLGLRPAAPAARSVVMASGEQRQSTVEPILLSDAADQRSLEVAAEIEADVPAVAGLFVERTWPCSVHDMNAPGKVPAVFHNVLRFEPGDRKVWLTQDQCIDGSGAFNYPTMTLIDSAHPRGHVDLLDILADPATDVGVGCEPNIANCDFVADLFDDRYLLFWSKESRAVAILDLTDWQVIFKRYGLDRGDLLDGFLFSPEAGHLTQVNTDGSFFVYRMADWQRALEGRYVDDEVVVWTPDLFFDATAEGAHFVTMKFPGQIGLYTFQQFDSRLRVPGLVEKVLAGNDQPNGTRIGVPPRLSGQLEARKNGRIVGTAEADAATPLDAVLVYQDGVLTDRIDAPAEGGATPIDIARLPGARWTSLVAVDVDGLVSLPMGRDLGSDPSARPTVHVLAVGVDRYDAEALADLKLAVSDAERMVDGIRSADGNTLTVAPPTVLTDAAAQPLAILAAAERLVSEAKQGETIVFFFAGHGIRGPDNRFYMATRETDVDDIPGTALSWDALSAVLAGAKARVAILLDACHSGAAGTDFFATNDDAVAGILETIPSGLVVFSASKGRQFSGESPAVGGGVFTNAVVDAIARRRDVFDTNGNGVIEVSELYAGVKRQVTRQTRGLQTPWLARNQMVGDFAFF